MRKCQSCCVAFMLLTLVATSGCGGAAKKGAMVAHAPEQQEEARADAAGQDVRKAKEAVDQKQPAGDVERKIIYTADVRLIVDDLDRTRTEVADLIKKYGGIVEDSTIQGKLGTPRSAVWRIRVPAAALEDFRGALVHLGEADKDSLSSRDVTDEYYDTRARMLNLQKVEKRLQEYLGKIKDTKDILKDVLAVESELTRVQSDIEVKQGQLQRLEKLTALTTVNLTVIERKDYIPPQAASFDVTIGRTFQDSVNALMGLGKVLVLVAVALAPWLPFMALLAGLIWLALKKGQRAGRGPSASQPATPPPAGSS